MEIVKVIEYYLKYLQTGPDNRKKILIPAGISEWSHPTYLYCS